MSLSISTSDVSWRRLLHLYGLWTLGAALALVVAVLGLDPYDTGRFALFGEHGVPQFGQRLAAASLGRQPQFDTAIIGNSTLQLVDPSRLGNVHAVSLTISGTGPREQLTVASWFLRHHPNARALVIGIDNRWCETGHEPAVTHPFPFWLYGENNGAYLGNMLNEKGLEASGRKIRLLLGLTPALRADGYNDYDTGHRWDRAGFRDRLKAPTDEGGTQAVTAPPYNFAAAPQLHDFLAQLPPDIEVVLVMPPQFHPALHGNAALEQNACAATYRDVADRRPHTRLMNFLIRPDLTAREENYWDRLHYRPRTARAMEKEIGGVLGKD